MAQLIQLICIKHSRVQITSHMHLSAPMQANQSFSEEKPHFSACDTIPRTCGWYSPNCCGTAKNRGRASACSEKS